MTQARKPTIKAKEIELSQEGETIVLRRMSKYGQMIEVKITAGQLHKWALRQMKEGAVS